MGFSKKISHGYGTVSRKRFTKNKSIPGMEACPKNLCFFRKISSGYGTMSQKLVFFSEKNSPGYVTVSRKLVFFRKKSATGTEPCPEIFSRKKSILVSTSCLSVSKSCVFFLKSVRGAKPCPENLCFFRKKSVRGTPENFFFR